jgi:hypothetical protein
MGQIPCELVLAIGDKLLKLECVCEPGAEYSATNALMEAMRDKIKKAYHAELGRPKSDQEVSRDRNNVRQR